MKPIQQRRLRILCAIFTELERLGCKISGNTHAGERFSIRVGGYWTYILFGVEGGASTSYFYRDPKSYKAADRERLRFDLVEHDDRAPPKRIWREEDGPLERQATDIVEGILLHAELETRKWALLQHKWAREDRERKVREARVAAERADAERIAREKALAAARIEALVSGAGELERAARIRRYVTAVRSACSVMSEHPSDEHLEKWCTWALAQADAIDPIKSQRFLADLGL